MKKDLENAEKVIQKHRKVLKDEDNDRKSDTKEAQRQKERLTDSFMEVERKI